MHADAATENPTVSYKSQTAMDVDPRLQNLAGNLPEFDVPEQFTSPASHHHQTGFAPVFPSYAAAGLRSRSARQAAAAVEHDGPEHAGGQRTVPVREAQKDNPANERYNSYTRVSNIYRDPAPQDQTPQRSGVSFADTSTPYRSAAQHQTPLYMPADRFQPDESVLPQSSPFDAGSPDAKTDAFNFPLQPNPPDLEAWRARLFNISAEAPLLLTAAEYQAYFPHIDNVYSHRSTQKYKRKPFVSHYFDCRLKGRPPGTPKSEDPGKKKRKRVARERNLCDVKIKVTEFFGRDEAGGALAGADGYMEDAGPLTFVMEDVGGRGQENANVNVNGNVPFGVLEPTRRFPDGHPGLEGKRWYMIQRVTGGKDGEEIPTPGVNLDHKHTLEESDRIKKNSVQRWLLKEEKERKKQNNGRSNDSTAAAKPGQADRSEQQQLRVSGVTLTDVDDSPNPGTSTSSSPTYLASGLASLTVKAHAPPASNHITFYANSFCPFAQRVWIALEIKQIPYQFVQIMPAHLKVHYPTPSDLLEVNPEGIVPCIRHGNWGVWESGVVLEYLEDLSMGHSLLPLGNPRLRAHCRLWVDHINRKILPAFYAMLLTPPATHGAMSQNLITNGAAHNVLAEQHALLITTLQKGITALVDASHVTGPFFLGPDISFVDVAVAPWIIRLSRVLSYYRDFPRPEVGTRWQTWVDAIEADERVRKTVSEEGGYHSVYRGVGEEGWDNQDGRGNMTKSFAEINFAQRMVRSEGFGLGGDVYGKSAALGGVDM